MAAFVKHGLEYFLDQIVVSEQHAELSEGLALEASRDVPRNIPPNSVSFKGLRTVDGSLDNPQPGRSEFGVQDTAFPRVSDPGFRAAQDPPFDPDDPLFNPATVRTG